MTFFFVFDVRTNEGRDEKKKKKSLRLERGPQQEGEQKKINL